MSPYTLRLRAPAGMLLAIVLTGGCGSGVLEPAEMRISVVEGDRQVDSVLSVLPIPLRVQVMDHRNQPVPDVEVRWNASVVGGTLSSLTSLTDAQGIASVTYALGSRTGSYYVSASAAGVPGPPAWFASTAEPGAAVSLQRSFGGNALGVPGTALDPYGVSITDAYGNRVTGVAVDWLVTEGGGTVHPAQSATHPHATTRHTLGSAGGQQTVIAVVSGLPSSAQVTFTATAVTAMVMITSNSPSCYYYGVPCTTEFVPDLVTISRGQSVAWAWSSLTCDVVFEDDPSGPVSAHTRSSGTHLRTFSVPGTYRYRCTSYSSDFHTGMVGAVVVQ